MGYMLWNDFTINQQVDLVLLIRMNFELVIVNVKNIGLSIILDVFSGDPCNTLQPHPIFYS